MSQVTFYRLSLSVEGVLPLQLALLIMGLGGGLVWVWCMRLGRGLIWVWSMCGAWGLVGA